MKFATKYTYKPDPSLREKSTKGTGITEQGEAYTIRELYARFTTNQPLPITVRQHDAQYPETVSHDDLDYQSVLRQDPVDREQIINENKTYIAQLEQTIEQQKLEAEKIAQEQAEKERLAAESSAADDAPESKK